MKLKDWNRVPRTANQDIPRFAKAMAAYWLAIDAGFSKAQASRISRRAAEHMPAPEAAQ